MNKIRFLFILAAILLYHGSALSKDINWDKVSSQKIALFYPGVASWEFLTSDDHRLGGRNIKEGKKSCPECHLSKSGEFDLRAEDIAAS